MFLIYDQPIGAGRCECLRYNGGGDEAQISTQWVLTLVDAFLHADHERAPSTAEVLGMLDWSAFSPRRGHHKGSTHHRIPDQAAAALRVFAQTSKEESRLSG